MTKPYFSDDSSFHCTALKTIMEKYNVSLCCSGINCAFCIIQNIDKRIIYEKEIQKKIRQKKLERIMK